MKHTIKLFILVFILLSISACGSNAVDDQKSLHELKMDTVAMVGNIPVGSSDQGRLFAFFMGERHLKYYFDIPNDSIYGFGTDMIAEELSGPENFSYNLSYLLNLPAKLFRNIQADFGVGPVAEDISKLSQSQSEALPGAWLLAIQDIISAVIGFFLAFIMMFIGTIIGTILHPIESVTDFIPCCWGLVKTIYYAVIHLFTW